MTPGAGTAHVVGRVACRRMRAGRWLNVVSRWLVCGVARGAPFMTPGAGTAHVVGRVACRRMWAGRRLVCGIASVIRASQVAPLRLRAVDCCFASVIRASQVAPLRLRAVDCCFSWLFCGVARGGAIYDARCRNGTCGWLRCVSADASGASVDCCFAGGCWRRNEGLSGKGDGYEKKKPD